jgi:ubiquitin carboxyl-terminal hydrolase 5/13
LHVGLDDPIVQTTKKSVDAAPGDIASLTDMGFTAAQAKKALHETSNNLERAVEWLFGHPDDQGLMDAQASSSITRPPPPGIYNSSLRA